MRWFPKGFAHIPVSSLIDCFRTSFSAQCNRVSLRLSGKTLSACFSVSHSLSLFLFTVSCKLYFAKVDESTSNRYGPKSKGPDRKQREKGNTATVWINVVGTWLFKNIYIIIIIVIIIVFFFCLLLLHLRNILWVQFKRLVTSAFYCTGTAANTVSQRNVWTLLCCPLFFSTFFGLSAKNREMRIRVCIYYEHRIMRYIPIYLCGIF